MKPMTDSSRMSISPNWRLPLLSWLALLALLLILFFPSLQSMVLQWWRSSTYGHAFLIPPISLYLVYLKQRQLKALTPRASWLGLLWLIGAGLVWLVGHLAQVNLFQHISVVMLIQGSVLLIFGHRIARVLVFPLGYLFFMVPFGDFAIAPLQDLTARYTTWLLRLTGIPVYMENWTLVIPGGSFLVAEACAGVRYLIACVALGVLISGLMFERWWKRAVFMALSVLVPIVANVLRAWGIVIIAHLSDFEMAVGVDHLIYGFFFLSAITLILILIAVKMRDVMIDPLVPDATPESDRQPALRTFLIALAGLGLMTVVRAYGDVASAPVSAPDALIAAPEARNGWTLLHESSGDDWRGRFRNADRENGFVYEKGEWRISYYVAYYAGEHKGKELISHLNSLALPGERSILRRVRLQASPDGTALPPPALLMTGHERRQFIVWYWYMVNSETSSDPNRMKLEGLLSKLAGKHGEGAVVALAYERADQLADDDPEEILADFIHSQGIDALLRSGDPASVLDVSAKSVDTRQGSD